MSHIPSSAPRVAPADEPSTGRRARDRPWVDVQTVHNALVHNHFADVLQLYARRDALHSDCDYPTYDPVSSFSRRMQRLSRQFRRQVAGAFVRRVGLQHVALVQDDTAVVDVVSACEATLAAIRDGKKLVVGAVLVNDERRLLARVPLLLRVDVADQLFGLALCPREDPPHSRHVYVAVGAKRRPLDVSADGRIGKRSQERMQVEMWLWNRILTDVQGCDVGRTLMVGLHPNRKKPVAFGAVPPVLDCATLSDNCVFDANVWRMAVVPFGDDTCSLGLKALEALNWRLHVVDDGWKLIEEAGAYLKAQNGAQSVEPNYGGAILRVASHATDVRWRPNMKCASMYDWPWVKAKRIIATQLCELTLVSGISKSICMDAMKRGIPNNYEHPDVTAEALQVNSHLTNLVLKMAKPDYNGPPVMPQVLPHNRLNWRQLEGFNHNDFSKFDRDGPLLPMAEQRTFYVDFELASPENLFEYCEETTNDSGEEGNSYNQFFEDCTLSVEQESRPVEDQSLIFMIGCGQVIDGKWIHKVFTAESLCRNGEGAVVCEWLSHMYSVMPAHYGAPILNVWGPEKSLLRKAMRRMSKQRLAELGDRRIVQYVDMLHIVITGCLVVRGGLSNSLKSVVKSLENLGRLEVVGGRSDEDSISDGGDAMAVALTAEEERLRGNLQRLQDFPQMKHVARYNEADCRDIARVAEYLRENH